MIAPEESPIHHLVTRWRASRPPAPSGVHSFRVLLFTTAVHELNAQAARNVGYDPMHDHRFLWASQWLDVAEGSRSSISTDTAALCEMLVTPPPPPSRKHASAGDHAA